MPEISSAIDLPRLKALLDGINRFGRNPETGGFNRIGYSDADMAVRRWFGEEMVKDGLSVHMDAVGNVFGRFGPADGPCVLAGSHLDTVPEGGAFDGALGVAVALESVRALREAGIEPGVAVEVVATAEEEGRFGGMLGSQAIAGEASREWLEAATDADGVPLAGAMRKQGLEPERLDEARRDPGEITAFMELHIEQGPVLERRGIAIGIAEAISGVCNLAVHFAGTANHSGTTPMEGRRDAFSGLALFGTAIPQILTRHGSDQSRMTIGKVDLFPNFIHTVPGVADCVVNIRDTDAGIMRALAEATRVEAEKAARENGLELTIEQTSWLLPVRLDADLMNLVSQKARDLGLETLSMPSGAGHDAQTMQSVYPSALIFVRSRDGISHAPQEWSEWSDIEKGASLYLATLKDLIRA